MWDVYGIGNALVDMEFRVNDDFLATHGIDKSRMVLIDADRLALLTNATKKPAQRFTGGSAANTMATIACLGGRSFFSCQVGDDPAGHFFLQDMATAGVCSELEKNKLSTSSITSTSLIFVTPDSERSMCTHIDSSGLVSADSIDENIVAHSSWIYLEGYLAAFDQTIEAAVQMRQYAENFNVKVAANLSDFNIIKDHRAGLEAILGTKIDLLFCNEEEAMAFAGVGEVKNSAEALLSVAKTCVVTRREKGIWCFDGVHWFEVAAFPIKLVDATGAGDSLAGAFLNAINKGRTYRAAAIVANLAGAATVSQAGPRLKHFDDLLRVVGG